MTQKYITQSNVAIITMSNPPVNALSYPMRLKTMDALRSAEQDPEVSAIVLTGDGKAFCGGADINEFDTPDALAEPTAWTLIAALEQSSKPVVAAIHSVCMGGGFEVALGCHYRVAASGCKFAFPEVRLGILPGAGGTQRLPRAIDVETALNMIVSGETVSADVLYAIPDQKLIDRLSVSTDTLLNEAVEMAQEAAKKCVERIEFPKLRNLKAKHANCEGYFHFVKTAIAAAYPKSEAAKLCVVCVEAATAKSFDEGIEIERKNFLALAASSEFRALKHLFLAERAAVKLDLKDGKGDIPKLRDIKRVGIVGAGLMGTGIAINFLNAGIPVTVLEVKQESLDKGIATIQKTYTAQVAKGKLSKDKLETRMSLLTPTLSYDDFSESDLIIEAVFEDMSIKEKVLQQMDRVAKPGAILASNTSMLDLNKLAQFTKRPQDVVGLHFFSPAHIMKLLEIVRGDLTAPDVLATVLAVATKIRKTAVISGVCDGFIGNRMIEELLRQGGFLIDEGASPQQIDKAMEAFGMQMGPYKVADMAGNDISWFIRQRRAVERPELRYSQIGNRLYKLGRHGVKSGAGWYDYISGRRDPIVSETMTSEINAHRQEIGITPRKISNKEIVERLIYALVNEGARILDEGIAARASDIDMVYILGYGFPVWRGGPMQYANEIGLNEVVSSMKRFATNPHADPSFWHPAALLQQLSDNYKRFGDA
ncbi:MAG: enoyl-CoA hydratase/isomerase family protein [Gammaproteobacteria bacterium]|nr:enoyl-CoA hydratase/isomerase family protein [Gammaproteobacteria bacterium]